ncbi:MAG: acetylornithine deacetylase [Gammaproteobacteria bacterium]|nr:MAG: acetylornithine deacetylase [Gammaproteobacteria bacterium]
MPSRLPKLIPMISELIASPSISSVNSKYDLPNIGVIELLAQWCESLGFSVQTQTVDKSRGKANLIATLGQGPGGLILSGHTDTVPYDDNYWQHNPFQVTESDNRLFGLGTADMKSFLAIALSAIQQIDIRHLQKPLILLATADEESSMDGAKALVASDFPRSRKAIIGEPTSLKPVRMHKGIMMESIHIQGQSGHSSDPELGNNALEGMHKVIQAIMEWRNELQEKNINDAFAVPVPTLNLGHIHGGDNPNRICGQCELHIDLRPLPGMEIVDLREELYARATNAVADSGLKLTTQPLFSGIPAMQTPATSELVVTAEQLTGFSAEAVAFGTEASYLQQLGNEVIVLGPGNIDQAHQPDEYLALDQVKPMQNILEQFIIQYCM